MKKYDFDDEYIATREERQSIYLAKVNKGHQMNQVRRFLMIDQEVSTVFRVYETVSRQTLSAGNIAKSMTSAGNSALLPIVDRRPPIQRGLMNFQLYSKSLRISSYITTLESRISMFPSASQEAKLTVCLGTSHCVNCFMYRLRRPAKEYLILSSLHLFLYDIMRILF